MKTLCSTASMILVPPAAGLDVIDGNFDFVVVRSEILRRLNPAVECNHRRFPVFSRNLGEQRPSV